MDNIFFKTRSQIVLLFRRSILLWRRTLFFFRSLYKKLKIYEIEYFFLFLTHRYSAKQFSPLHVFENLRTLVRVRSRHGLTATRSGKLMILPTYWEKRLFALKNFLLFGALQKRVERVVLYTYLTVTLELNNPFTKKVLMQFLEKKIALLERLLEHVKTINGKAWDQFDIQMHIDIFRRSSLLQAEVIKNMQLAVKRQKEPSIIKEAKAALIKGLYPILITQGVSGSYWMRGVNRQILGLFKPFDEEIHAPNNPVGPSFQGALGHRKTRRGCRSGESAHHEVGAFVVDSFFGFGIVPKTYYAEFSHPTFFLAREKRASRRAIKKKIGSFQEFVGGFVSVNKLSKEEINAIPLDEFQLLVVLDVIIGNTDRNVGNILFGDEKIAAIDHGLCFSDRVDDLCCWYWAKFEQGKKPLFQPIVDLLNAFPFEALEMKLRKRCFISPNSLHRMRERVVLFTEAINAGLVPSQLEELFTLPYLIPLQERNVTLKEAATEQVRLYKEKLDSLPNPISCP